ncbi:MAG: DUF429 domain-containing protein [Campylobacterales bacterium]
MRITPAPYYVGIDLAWAPGNPSGVAVIDTDARLIEYRYTDSIEAVMDVIGGYPHCAVGVDAPLIIPNETGHRPNERDFLKTFARYGLGVHAVNTVLFEKRFPCYTGFELFARLKAAGFGFDRGNLFEVYLEVITVPNTDKKPLETLKGKALKGEEDFLDSLVCAYTLLYCTENTCLCFGNGRIGKLLTPKPEG